jgi:hypothetical protein
MVQSDHNAFISHRKFPRAGKRTVSLIRQEFGLLNSNRNFADSEAARFQRLSAPIGRFLEISSKPDHISLVEKRPSALMIIHALSNNQ